MLLVSIIIPIYNAEAYIEACLDSLRRQTFTDFELIAVDDGSTDRSADIVERYAREDARVKLVRQAHKGVSAARNSGMDRAVGTYLMFMDSDDWVEPNMLEVLCGHAAANGADILICDMAIDDEMTGETEILRHELPDGVLLQREQYREAVFPHLVRQRIFNSASNKLYRRALARFRMDEASSCGEDWKFNLEMFDAARTLCYVNRPFYHYMQRYNSSLTKKYRRNRFEEIALWYYRNARAYAQKWRIPLQQPSRMLVAMTISSILGEFSRYNPATLGQKLANIRRYVLHPLVREAIGSIKAGDLPFPKQVLFLLMKLECVWSLAALAALYKGVHKAKLRLRLPVNLKRLALYGKDG